MNHADLLQPSRVSVIDLSDTALSEFSNFAVADVLRSVQEEQEKAYCRFERGQAAAPPRLLVIFEEAHKFLSEERIDKMPVLFQQIARLAKPCTSRLSAGRFGELSGHPGRVGR
jgi:DNA helicase HerA-like ATPase